MININIEEDFLYLQNLAGDDIKINGVGTYKALINYFKTNRYEDLRTIATMTEIKRGDIITWDGEDWLVISEIGHKRFCYYKGIIQKVNYNIKFIFDNGSIKEFPAIIDGKIFDIESNQFFYFQTGKVIVLLQDNDDTRKITIDRRFIKRDKAFKVVGTDWTEKGLIKLYCELDMFNTNDDRKNEIADYETYKHTFSIKILNNNPLNLNINGNNEVEIMLACTDNGVTVEPDNVIFEVSDPAIAKVEGNKFICLDTGTVTLTASWNGVSDSIVVNCVDVDDEIHNYAVTIEGSDTIFANRTNTYIARFTDNGTPVDKVAIWTLTGDDDLPTTAASLQNITDTSCELVAGKKKSIYLKLKVAASDGTCECVKRILITSFI